MQMLWERTFVAKTDYYLGVRWSLERVVIL